MTDLDSPVRLASQARENIARVFLRWALPVGGVGIATFALLFALTSVSSKRMLLIAPLGVSLVIAEWLRRRDKCVGSATIFILGMVFACTLGALLHGPSTPGFLGFLAVLCFVIPIFGMRWGAMVVVWMALTGGLFLLGRSFEAVAPFSPLPEPIIYVTGVMIGGVMVALLGRPTRLLVQLLEAQRSRLEEVERASARERETAAKLQEASVELAAARRLEALGKLSGGIAHDFNNMLSVVVGATELIAASPECTTASELAESVDLIRTATSRAADLTRSLLAFGRRESLVVDRLNVNRIVSDVATLARPTFGKTARLETKCSEEPLFVHGDSSALTQALLNLVLNARDAVSEGGIIQVETRAMTLEQAWCDASPFEIVPGDVAHVSVQDDGVGMPEEVRQRSFEPFFTTKEIGRGTGLGLSAVHGTISSHRGAIDVNSEPDRGTVFNIYLPMNASDVRPAPRGSARVDPSRTWPPTGASSAIALVVDDDELSGRAVARLVGQLGFQCERLDSAGDALELLHGRADIALVVSDVVMPGLDGPSFVEEVSSRYPHMAVVLMSGFAPEGLLSSLPTDRHIPLLRKPFDAAELRAALTSALESVPPRKPSS